MSDVIRSLPPAISNLHGRCCIETPIDQRLVTVFFPYPWHGPSSEKMSTDPERWKPNALLITVTGQHIQAIVINARYIHHDWVEEETGKPFTVLGAKWYETEVTRKDASPKRLVINEDLSEPNIDRAYELRDEGFYIDENGRSRFDDWNL
jgi:hypothetical protein